MYGYLFESAELLSCNQYGGEKKKKYIVFRRHLMESNAKFKISYIYRWQNSILCT